MSTKVLYFGGQKSGKSSLAQEKALQLASPKKPFYVATYDDSFGDQAMKQRIEKHKQSRQQDFETVCSAYDIVSFFHAGETYLIDCLSMWLFNNIHLTQESILEELKKLESLNCNIVFVLNDVNSGVIPTDDISRRYVDLSGVIGQFVASFCDEVYEVKLGIGVALK